MRATVNIRGEYSARKGDCDEPYWRPIPESRNVHGPGGDFRPARVLRESSYTLRSRMGNAM